MIPYRSQHTITTHAEGRTQYTTLGLSPTRDALCFRCPPDPFDSGAQSDVLEDVNQEEYACAGCVSGFFSERAIVLPSLGEGSVHG